MKIHVVNLLEYENGWGGKVFDTLYFQKEENALSYIKEYNSKNNLNYTPDYYTKAEFRKTIDLPDNIIFEDAETAEFEIAGFLNLTGRYDSYFRCYDYTQVDKILDILIEQDICSKEKLIQFRNQINTDLKSKGLK